MLLAEKKVWTNTNWNSPADKGMLFPCNSRILADIVQKIYDSGVDKPIHVYSFVKQRLSE